MSTPTDEEPVCKKCAGDPARRDVVDDLGVLWRSCVECGVCEREPQPGEETGQPSRPTDKERAAEQARWMPLHQRLAAGPGAERCEDCGQPVASDADWASLEGHECEEDPCSHGAGLCWGGCEPTSRAELRAEIDRLRLEVERLRGERDRAQRDLCREWAGKADGGHDDPREHARDMRWTHLVFDDERADECDRAALAGVSCESCDGCGVCGPWGDLCEACMGHGVVLP